MNAKPTYEEGELVALLKQKNEQAFGYLYDNYAGALCGVVRQIVPDVEICHDVVQEVFVSIWRKIDTYDAQKGRLFTWMLNIARNASIDKVRSRNYQQALKQQPIDDNEMAHPVVRQGIDDYGLKKVLMKLKDEHRMLVDLSYYQGYTHDQIAKALNIPLGTVKTRLRAALIQLRTMLT
ncbi:MAG: polymerase sigma-70 factor [Flaviaesturariibacter sp.]|nr:polymerase sigma-70 factor [Flaviaesturariibacter sp.]